MNLVLIGYRGTGKSCVAHRVAPALGWSVVSLDEEIVRRSGRSIPEIVKELGWDAFRNLEEEACRRAAALNHRVIDCGGGVVERERNFDVLRSCGKVVWLTASPEVIVERIQGDNQRPALTEGKSFTDEVSEVLQRRTPLYRRLAHTRVDTDHRSLVAVAEAIIGLMQVQLSHGAVAHDRPTND